MVSTAAAVVLILAACSYGQPELPKETVFADDFKIEFTNGKIKFSLPNHDNGATLKGQFGVTIPEKSRLQATVCADDPVNCLQFGSDIRLKGLKQDQCYYFNWTANGNITLEDCFEYGTDNWYGGPENLIQLWPFNNMTFPQFSYVTKAYLNQALVEPYWVTSSGFYVYADKRTPLFIDANHDVKQGLCLVAKQYPPYLPRGETFLGYKVCAYENVRVAHLNAVKHELGSPKGIPDHRMIKHPIWSTWARYKKNVNDSIVRTFANKIIDSGFNNSQLEIDDNWETCYGSTKFNKSRFPDMPGLGKYLHSLGFRITLWRHPFVNTNCDLFSNLKEKKYLVRDQNGNVESAWWDGPAGVVDFTNPDAARWFLKHHRKMMAHNQIDGLKLDAGETSWLPQLPQLNAEPLDQPLAFTAAYARTVAQFGSLTELRVGHGTQDLPRFVRMIDKDSTWTFDNGLPTLLTTLFQMNLSGYTLVLPDMVGGNAYLQSVSKELFIRWLQANTFMPAIQFSISPFDFDNETVEISQRYTSLHAAYAGEIIKAMESSVQTGSPVNAPIWWGAPTDPVAHSVWDEYLLGEDILVAPVIVQGATSRDIYLPCGKWRDEADPQHEVYDGQQWLRNYPAPLAVLPYFTRVGTC